MSTSSAQTSSHAAEVGIDGYIRITVEDLFRVDFQHMDTELELCGTFELKQCGTRSSIWGFTEWVSKDHRLSLGWDWFLVCRNGARIWECLYKDCIRSNVLIVDDFSRDLPVEVGQTVLESLVERIPWRGRVLERLRDKYAV